MKLIIMIICCFVTVNADILERSIDGIVKDSTGLEWQDTIESKELTLNWTDAVAYCETLEINGLNDWRLPNINELKSILSIEFGGIGLYILPGFLNTSLYNYWSSTTMSADSHDAWITEFYHAQIYASSKYNNNHVRCVRDGQ